MTAKEQPYRLPEPDSRPGVVPNFAERMDLKPHFRLQFVPTLLNALGNPDVNGPRDYTGIEYRCPVCKHIQPAGPPGKDNVCTKCELIYCYTAAKTNTWLYIWRAKPKIEIGESVEFTRSFQPGVPLDPQKSNNNQSGFLVNTSARKKDE